MTNTTENKAQIYHGDKKSGMFARCLIFVLTGMLLCGCGAKDAPQNEPMQTKPSDETGFVVAGPEGYDSADTAILIHKDEEENTLTFFNLKVKKAYTLSYDGTTSYYDKYGQAVALTQIYAGQLVDVTFLKNKKHLTTMKLSKEAWAMEDVSNYEFNLIKGEVSVGKDVYQMANVMRVFTEEGTILDKKDLNVADVISLYGIDTTVYSILIKKGHGYLRLINDEYFLDGWIEIGKSQIQKIIPDMLLTVTEGRYQVTVSNRASSGVKDVVINRNQETILDIGDIEVAKPKQGLVTFTLEPEAAKVYIDGTQIDTASAVTLEYGLHQLIAKASGYKTLTQYIRVGQENANIDITMEEESKNETSTNTTGSSDTVSTKYKVFIDAPADVQVYVDSKYIGTTPCSFDKTPGNHVVTLRKDGYTTKSYTITVDEEKKDISYSFADLEKEGSTQINTDELTKQIWDNIFTE